MDTQCGYCEEESESGFLTRVELRAGADLLDNLDLCARCVNLAFIDVFLAGSGLTRLPGDATTNGEDHC